MLNDEFETLDLKKIENVLLESIKSCYKEVVNMNVRY